jgi:glycogen phosphorylase
MIENTNFWTGIHASLLRIVRAELLITPRKWHFLKRNASGNVTPMRNRSAERVELKYRSPQGTTVVPLPPQIATLAGNPAQWLLENAPLANLITETIGDRWIEHSDDLQQLATLADAPLFQSQWQQVKRAHKQVLADKLARLQGVRINVDSLFDLQLQPISIERRQLLNILHIINLFLQLKENPQLNIVPRTFIFGHVGKLAPDPYILTLIQSLAAILAQDPAVSDKLQVVYVPYSAKLRQQMYHAADVTEEIEMATMEDVDLSKLKFAANGVISIGSAGKANYLVQETVGIDNYFSFGLASPEITLFAQYGYDPYNYYKYYSEVRRAIDYLLTGCLTPEDPHQSKLLVDMLLGTDKQMVLADYIFYLGCQNRVSEVYQQPSAWTRMSILNVSGLG